MEILVAEMPPEVMMNNAVRDSHVCDSSINGMIVEEMHIKTILHFFRGILMLL